MWAVWGIWIAAMRIVGSASWANVRPVIPATTRAAMAMPHSVHRMVSAVWDVGVTKIAEATNVSRSNANTAILKMKPDVRARRLSASWLGEGRTASLVKRTVIVMCQASENVCEAIVWPVISVTIRDVQERRLSA